MLRSLAIANFDLRLVTFPHGVADGFLAESDLTLLLKVLLALLLLVGAELGDVRVVALLNVIVDALEDWIFSKSFYSFFLDHTKSSICSSGSFAKVNST